MKLPKQPEVNIGMVGHVDHGKTTLTKALTGVWADTYSEELKRGITIKLGYADTAFYKCKNNKKETYTTSSKSSKKSDGCELSRVVSFVDAPGHETLMATMLSGAAIMNGALLLIAANEKCPQPQTKEHLMALDIMGVKNIVIVQNKADLVDDKKAQENYEEIKEFVKGTVAENAPIIPISAHHDMNIDILIESIEKQIPTPDFDEKKPPMMYIARSFDINKPGSKPDDLSGGVLGGSLIQGKFNIGDEIEISPGLPIQKNNNITWEPIYSVITSLITANKNVKVVKPGGLVGIGTQLDPTITKGDSLTGKMVAKPGTLPDVLMAFSMETHLLDTVIGSAREIEVDKIKPRETLMLNVGTSTTIGTVMNIHKDEVEVSLKYPIISEKNQRIAIGRRIQNRWRLIGFGIIK